MSKRLLAVAVCWMLNILGNMLQIMSVDSGMGGGSGGFIMLGALGLFLAWAAFALPTLRYWEFI